MKKMHKTKVKQLIQALASTGMETVVQMLDRNFKPVNISMTVERRGNATIVMLRPSHDRARS